MPRFMGLAATCSVPRFFASVTALFHDGNLDGLGAVVEEVSPLPAVLMERPYHDGNDGAHGSGAPPTGVKMFMRLDSRLQCAPGRGCKSMERGGSPGFKAVKNRAVSNRTCVAAMRGGEQRNENDQSVTQTARRGRRRELDSVGGRGRVGWRPTKPVAAGQPRWQSGDPRSTRRWLETEWLEVLLR